jgi:hypothetical protein
MALQVTINDITGVTPFDITSTPYVFDIPVPYDTSTEYMLKVVDRNGCIITGIESVASC